MRIWSLVLVAALACFVFSLPAGAETSQSVTLTVIRTYDKLIRNYKLRFTGAISSGEAGEDVTVVQQTCGYSFATAVAGTQTRAGGAWDAEPVNPIVIAPSATYRARWRNEQSEPVSIRPEIPVFLVPVGRGRLLFRVTIGNVQQDMRGRVVVLERLRNKKWTRIQQKRLIIDRAGFSGYVATFVVPRGWTVRARIPAKAAAPCFKPNTTDKVRSS